MFQGLRRAVRIQRHLGASVGVHNEAAAIARTHADDEAATVAPCPAAASEDDTGAMAWNMATRRRVAKVVGPRSGHADPVLRTTRMEQLVNAHLRIVAGDASGGDATTSYRDWYQRELDHRVRAGYVEVGRDERTGRTWQRRSGTLF